MANDILSKFIKAINDEFADQNWDYLTYIADRVRVVGYVNQLSDVHNAAVAYIKSVLEMRGSGYELIAPDAYDEETDDEVYQLPRGYTVGKYGMYDEFPLVMINLNEKNELVFVGISVMSEGVDEDKHFIVEELSTEVVCAVADRVRELEGDDGRVALDNFLESADMPQD